MNENVRHNARNLSELKRNHMKITCFALLMDTDNNLIDQNAYAKTEYVNINVKNRVYIQVL